MDTTQNSPENRGSQRIGLSPNLALWASAFVLIGLIILAAGRVSPARADMVTSAGTVTALTVECTTPEDLLCVVDNRSETLCVYKIINQNNLELYRTYNLPQMYSGARSRAGGR